MTTNLHESVARFLHTGLDELSERERHVVDRFLQRKHLSRNTTNESLAGLTLGQRVADRMAT